MAAAPAPDPPASVYTIEYADGECGVVIAVFTTLNLARAFWAALPPGRWGSYTVCQEHCDVREYPLLTALPDMAQYAGRRAHQAGHDLEPVSGARLWWRGPVVLAQQRRPFLVGAGHAHRPDKGRRVVVAGSSVRLNRREDVLHLVHVVLLFFRHQVGVGRPYLAAEVLDVGVRDQ